jgi:hypothetical protein
MFPNSIQSKRNLRIAAITCIALLGTAFAPRATADLRDKKTIVTFSAPVEVPGKVLPAGTYVFKLLDSASTRTVLQIYDKDEKHVLATILAVPDYRTTPADKPVIALDERSSDSPEALKAFFYPGDNYGLDFVYPHQQAMQLAKRTNQNVLSMRDSMSANMAKPNQAAGDASVQEMEKTEINGVSPSGDPVELEIIIRPARAK